MPMEIEDAVRRFIDVEADEQNDADSEADEGLGACIFVAPQRVLTSVYSRGFHCRRCRRRWR
jgi:hypothetical protein